ncbi:MAG: V-type ATP synthase subunit E family protein [Syntrophales bacterium]|jgi:V/A-type H+-transporting ATPase subunit E|nr:V-type ATP synthase subunit E family protein [Syntrophales bacterium]NLN60794.1 hypothetical protein [Deltaproteobacteria bacterium]
MVETLNSLIEKIKNEGIEEAEATANRIEDEARERARRIVEEASVKADAMIAEAKKTIEELRKNDELALAQAGRNLLIALRQQINAMLLKVVKKEISASLSDDMLSDIMRKLILEQSAHPETDYIVVMTQEELNSLDAFFTKLQEEIKKGITLRHFRRFDRGFVISYDGGKSFFSFTDDALGEALMTYLKPRMAAIFREINDSTQAAV